MTYHLHIARYSAPIRLIFFLLCLLSIWLPRAIPIYWLVQDRNLMTILTMGLLFVDFLFLVRLWGKKMYQQPKLLDRYGLVGTRKNAFEFFQGLGLGVSLIFCLFGLEGLFGWVIWQNSPRFAQTIMEALAVGLGVGFAEELVFRGWLLDELQRDYSLKVSLWLNAILFAILHFIKPFSEILRTWLQFPGLLILGLILVWGKRSCRDRLGLSIGLHAGLVGGYYIINVGQLIQYSGTVPDWITGVDRNPLAGVMGLLFLGAVAVWIQKRYKTQTASISSTSNNSSL